MLQKAIYLDYNSTSPTDPRVLESMLPFFKDDFGNPSNTLHPYGWAAGNAVAQATLQVAALVKARPSDVVWNAGATEGNNSVVFGLIRRLKCDDPKSAIHLVTSNAEHWSVLNSFAAAAKYENVDITLIPINAEGIVTVEELRQHLRPETKLVSLIWVNNEIGSINPIHELATECHARDIYFHTDATQAVGKVAIDLQKTPVHFLTFSAHKFCGPKGAGALITRAGNSIEIDPYIFGGGQQNGRRSGTLNVPAIVGCGAAAEILQKEMASECARTREMLSFFLSQLQENLPDVKLNGARIADRSPVNLSLLMPKPIDFALPKLGRLAFSQGSACQSGETSTSHVLAALGLAPLQAQRTMRLSIGRFTTPDELQTAFQVLTDAFRV